MDFFVQAPLHIHVYSLVRVLASAGDMGVCWLVLISNRDMDVCWLGLASNGDMGVCVCVCWVGADQQWRHARVCWVCADQQWKHGCVLAGC